VRQFWQWINLPHLPAAWVVLDRGAQRKNFWRLLKLMHACAQHEACGKCGPCRQAAANIHPAQLTLEVPEGKREIPLSAVRALKSSLILTARELRLVGILEAEYLSLPAQEALLKIVEEPPPQVRFVLMVSDFATINAPLLSRCLRFVLVPPPPAERLRHVVRGKLSSEQQQRLLALPLLLSRVSVARGLRLASALSERVRQLDLLLEIWQDYLRAMLREQNNEAAAEALRRVVWARKAIREKWAQRNAAVYACLARRDG
jgi:DNA polymerase III delta prime subunit